MLARRYPWMVVLILTLIGAGQGMCSEPCSEGVLQRFAPAGGWCPYGGPLRWWPRYCFPRCGAPDDYCRKSLPCVCWPPYPSYYIWGLPEVCCPKEGCGSNAAGGCGR